MKFFDFFFFDSGILGENLAADLVLIPLDGSRTKQAVTVHTSYCRKTTEYVFLRLFGHYEVSIHRSARATLVVQFEM